MRSSRSRVLETWPMRWQGGLHPGGRRQPRGVRQPLPGDPRLQVGHLRDPQQPGNQRLHRL